VEKPDLATANQFLAELEREAFTRRPSVALDVAVMERTGLGNVLQ